MGVRIGELVAIQDGVVPYVVFQDQQGSAAIRARAVTSLSTQDIGRAIVVSFVDGDLTQPVVIGCVRDDRTPRGAMRRPKSKSMPMVEHCL